MADDPHWTDQVMLVTGATDGIGKQTALELARTGARLFVHGRDATRTAGAVAAIRQASGNRRVAGLVADFGSLAKVRHLVETIRQQTDRLDVLVNNAGVYMKKRVLTEDGIETTLQVNHVAPFVLTNGLLDLLARSAPSRIVNVSSVAHARGRIDFNDLNGQWAFDGYKAYAQSKLANLLFTRALDGRLRGLGVTVNAVHPGVVSTKLLQAGFNITGSSVQDGAATSIYLALSDEVAGASGNYYTRCALAEPSPAALDWELGEELWRATEHLVADAERKKR